MQNSMADYLLGLMSNSEAQLGAVTAQLRNWYTGLYFQDQWKVTSKLTVITAFATNWNPDITRRMTASR